MAAQRQLRLHAVLQRGEPQLLQAGGPRPGERHIGQRGPAPQPEGLAQERAGAGRITIRERPAPLPGQPLEAVRVHRVRVDRQPVPGGVELQQPAFLRAEAASQPRHLRLQGVGRVRRGILAVQAVDQALSADHLTRVDQQQREEQSHPGTADTCWTPVGAPRFGRAEDAEEHVLDSCIPVQYRA